MFSKILPIFVASVVSLTSGTPCNHKNHTFMKIATGSKSGTYIKIGEDLARFVAPDSCINLEPMVTKGSIQNVYELLKTKFVALATVQSDVLGIFKDKADKGDRVAKRILNRLRLVKPLYLEEVHFITQKRSFLKNIQDIENSKINIGPAGSGTAMSAYLIYKELFGHNIPKKNIFNKDYNTALRMLLRGEIDIVVMVGGQPLAKLANMPQSAKDKIKILPYDEDSKHQVLSYEVTSLKSSNYSILNKDIPTISVQSYLITFDYGRNLNSYQKHMKKALARFAYNFRKNINLLKRNGHKKWKEVDIELSTPLRGWKYYDVTNFAYRFNPANCSRLARELTLCE